MRVRRATEADADAIAHVHRSARAAAYGPEYAERPRSEPDITFVADHDGAVVGFATVEGELLRSVYVLPGAQGSGAGTALMDAAEAEGVRELWVYSDNPARRFYEARGWVSVPGSEMTGDTWHPRKPGLRYRRG